MKYNSKRVLRTVMAFSLIIGMSANVFAHSGRTDKNGGHKDNNNVSGLGSYHYHCGGYPAHLHKNGVCQYKTSTSSSNVKESETKKETVVVTAKSVSINESITSMEKGETEKLTVSISPKNTENKKVTWKSSNKSVISVTSNGKITALEAGTATITVTTVNGKKDTIKITVNEPEKEEATDVVVETSSDVKENIVIENTNDAEKNIVSENISEIKENTMQESTNEVNGNKAIDNTKEETIIDNSSNIEESTNAGSGMLGLGILGGTAYLGYKKHKKSKK